MPKPFRALMGSCSIVLLAFAAPASAAVYPATATLSVQIATLDPPTMAGSGSASSVGGPGTAHTLPAGLLALATAVTVPVIPTFVGIGRVSLPTSITIPAGNFNPNGAMPVNGSALFFSGMGAGTIQVGTVPLQQIGGGGTGTFTVGPVMSAMLLGATWQGAGTSPQILTAMSAAVAINITVTATAYDNRTASGRGIVQLVAPATGDLGLFGALPVFGVLNIRYDVPEPSMMALGLVGGALLVAAGRRKMRSN